MVGDIASDWNEVMTFPAPTLRTVTVTSHASGKWDCSTWSEHDYYQFQWPADTKHHHIEFKDNPAIVHHLGYPLAKKSKHLVTITLQCTPVQVGRSRTNP